jgi:uncharacterized membrane protein YbhN (UPF0104 family)
MKTSTKRIIGKLWLTIFIVVALAFVFAYLKDHRDDLARLLDANLRYLAMAVLAHSGYFAFTVMAWRRVLRETTAEALGFREGLAQILLVNFGKYIPGKVWGVAARGRRLSEQGFSIEAIGRASYLEQALLLLTGFWLTFLCAAVLYKSPAYWFAVVLATIAIGLLPKGGKAFRGITKLLPRAGMLIRMFDLSISVNQVLLLSLNYLAVWLFLAAAFIFIGAAVVGLELAFANLAILVMAITAGFLSGFLALFAPGGVGIREGVGAAILVSIMTLENALLLMLLFRGWVVVSELLAGALVLGAGGRFRAVND